MASVRPWRSRGMRIGLALGALLVLYLAFELGRYSAGYSILAAIHEHAVLAADIERLKHTQRTLEARVAELQTFNAGHAHAEEVVTHTIAQLQAQIARQREKLAFYRGVLASGAPAIGVRVGEVQLSPGKRPLHFRADLSLLRSDRPDGEVAGTVSLSVAGSGPGGSTLNHQALTGHAADLRYRFRYYQEFKPTLVLPPGFKPERLTVTVRSSRPNIAPLVQTYPWSAISVP
jgi:hypothetical protein